MAAGACPDTTAGLSVNYQRLICARLYPLDPLHCKPHPNNKQNNPQQQRREHEPGPNAARSVASFDVIVHAVLLTPCFSWVLSERVAPVNRLTVFHVFLSADS